MLHFATATPEESGIPSNAVINFINRLEREKIPMHSILMMRHERLFAEAYYAPYTAKTLHRMFSCTKSFTSIAISFLADDGYIHLDDYIIDYFEEMLPEHVHPWIARMTIRDMLTMRTCHDATTYKIDLGSHWVQSFFTTPPTHPPGRIFHYDTSATHTLGALVERLTKKDMLTYLKEKCLLALGFSENSYMLKDPFGISNGGSGLVATPMDLLKFGYLISHNGKLDCKQLINANYIKEAISLQTNTCSNASCRHMAQGYGYQFWRIEHNGYACYGMGGQFMIALPDYDFICVTTADTQRIQGGSQFILDALFTEVLPFMDSTPLPGNRDKQEELLKRIKSLNIIPVPTSHTDSKSFCSDENV